MKKFILILVGVFSLSAKAEIEMSGRAIDGTECTVKVARNQHGEFAGIELKGSTEVFAILSDTGNGYGPETYIQPDGAGDVVASMTPNSRVLSSVRRSGTLNVSEEYRLQSDLDGLSAEESLKLKFRGGRLVKVEAKTKLIGLLFVTVGSSKFTCEL